MYQDENPVLAMARSGTVYAPGASGADAQVSVSDGTQPVGPARRQRGAETNNENSTNQHFYFVDQNSSSKEKRAHVMRHHVQEKRKQHKNSCGVPSTELEPGDVSNISPGASWTSTQPLNVETSLQIQFSNVKAQPPYSSLPQDINSPLTILHAPRRYPFIGLPIDYDSTDVELTDCWTNKLTYWSGQNTYVKNQIFRAAKHHPVSFKAVVLCYCARYRAKLSNEPDSDEIQRHVGQATRFIEDAASGSMIVYPDYLAMAFAGMALHEQRFGSRDLAQHYVERALQTMLPRTGMNRSVETFIHYIRYLIMPSTPTSYVPEQQRLLTCLRDARDIMYRHSRPDFMLKMPYRPRIFELESPLFALLSIGPRPSQVPEACRVYVIRDAHTQEPSRAASLIYVTMALWEFLESPDKTDRFLRYLTNLVTDHHLDRDRACETLLWLLLEEGCDPDLRNSGRAWSVGALLQLQNQLRPYHRFLWNEILMSFLSLQEPIHGMETFEEKLLRGEE